MLVGIDEYSSNLITDLDHSSINPTQNVKSVARTADECIMSMSLSSNNHMATAIMKKDNDEYWVSETSDEPVCLDIICLILIHFPHFIEE